MTTEPKPKAPYAQARNQQSGCGCGKPKVTQPEPVKPDEIVGPTDLLVNS